MSAVSGDALDVRPEVADPGRFGIGIVGSGNIVENAQIPSYLEAGYRLEALTSRTRANAERVAAGAGIDRVHDSVDELLADPAVDVVDVALPPHLQPDVVARAVRAGKHVLAQKPLAISYGEASEMVAAADAAGVTLAVNQNGRYDPSVNAARRLIADGLLGTRLVASISMCIEMPWQTYYEDPRYERLMILHMSVHHIDQLRLLFGDPVAVTAVGRDTPGPYFGETIAQYVLHYEDGFWASSLDDGTNWSDDFDITYRIQGTEASLKGVIGWPHGDPSTLSYQRKGEPGWTTPSFSRSWFPDAFSATMGELLASLEQGRAPANSGADNLTTMRAVLAAYRSIEERRTVGLDEVTAAGD